MSTDWLLIAPFPSPAGRGRLVIQSATRAWHVRRSNAHHFSPRLNPLLPLPAGEGRGEGENERSLTA